MRAGGHKSMGLLKWNDLTEGGNMGVTVRERPKGSGAWPFFTLRVPVKHTARNKQDNPCSKLR